MFFGDSITESMATASSALEIYREEYVTGVFGIGGKGCLLARWRLQSSGPVAIARGHRRSAWAAFRSSR